MQRAVSSCGHAEQPNGFRRHIQGRKGKRDTGVFQGLLPTLVLLLLLSLPLALLEYCSEQ